MRYIFWFWFVPMGIIWTWFGLSYYDLNFGFTFLSRAAHEFVFEVYATILGIERSEIVRLLVRACIFDTAFIFAIFGFRRRKDIRAWWSNRTSIEPLTDVHSTPSPAE